MLHEHVKLLGEAVALVGQPLKVLGKLPVDRSKIRPARNGRLATLFNRPGSVVIGIVRHDRLNELDPDLLRPDVAISATAGFLAKPPLRVTWRDVPFAREADISRRLILPANAVAPAECRATLAGTMTRISALLALGLALSACSAMLPSGTVIQAPPPDWRQTATSDDRNRLRDWRDAFMAALKAAHASGHGAEIAREGVLLEPDAAVGGGPIPNGDYRCRVIKLGAKSPGMLDYVAYPAFACRIRPGADAPAGVQELVKLTGSQRYVGLVFPGDLMRQVFLGTIVLGDEQRAMQYGRDKERNVAGFVERIGPNRWRMIMPRPHFESQIDVLELVPVG